MKKELKKLKLAALALSMISLGYISCNDDDDGDEPQSFQLTINMAQVVNNQALTMNTTDKPYTNKKGQTFNVSRLRYLISDLHFKKADGSVFMLDDYYFVDASDPSTMTFTPSTKVPEGDYSSIAFKFGFDEEDNTDGTYPDLNTLNWNWPSMLGGGYHNMQLEGEYDNGTESKPFATHMGTARNADVTPNEFFNNAVEIDLENSATTVNCDFSIDITMHIEQWYENPIEWDFDVWNAPIMPIFEAQNALKDNAPSVFSIEIN